MKERLDYIDTTKGILIILVVIGHIINGKSILKNAIYAFHMPAFLIISGYLMKEFSRVNDQSIVKFSLRKIKALIVPWLIFEAVYLFVDNVKYGWYMNINGLIFTCLKDCLTGNYTNYVDWFLIALLGAQFITFILIKSPKQVKIFIAVVVILTSLFIHNTKILQVVYSTIFVTLGYYLWDKAIFKKSCLGILVLVLILVAYLNGQVSIAEGRINNVLLFYIGSLSGTYISIFCGKLCEKCYCLQFLGKNSLYIMGLHVPVMYALSFINKLNVVSIIKYSIMFFGVMITTVSIVLLYGRIKQIVGSIYNYCFCSKLT